MREVNLLVGASSAVGKELIKLLIPKDQFLVCTYNQNKIKNNENLISYKVDLSSEKSINQFFQEIIKLKFKIKRIFFLAAIPGFTEPDLSFLNKPKINEFITFSTINCFSSVKILYEIISENLITENCKICFFSSVAGSISLRGKLIHNKIGGNLPYRLSKAALNCAVKNISYDLNQKYPKATIFAVHPGWLQNFDKKSNLSVMNSAERVLKLVEAVNPSQSGLFLDSLGTPLEY